MTHTVETLTAEIRVLRVGRRNVTLSMFKQLDNVSPWHIDAFGRVRSGVKYESDYYGYKSEPYLELIGTDSNGVLALRIA